MTKLDICKKFAKLVSEECHEKFAVNADIVDEILDELIDSVLDRFNHNCQTCIHNFHYNKCDMNKCKTCELHFDEYPYCHCLELASSLLPCPYFKEIEK